MKLVIKTVAVFGVIALMGTQSAKAKQTIETDADERSVRHETEIVLKAGERLRIKRMKHGEDLVCEVKRPTGTYIRKVSCVPESDFARQERFAKDYLYRFREKTFQVR